MDLRKYIITGLIIAATVVSCDPFAVNRDNRGGKDNTGKDKEEEPVKPSQDDRSTIYGYVKANGKGLAGVVVSDGHEVAVTDADGRYALISKKESGYVFISVPGGYTVPQDGVIPQFFQYTKAAASKQEQIDFELKETDQSRYKMLYFGDMHLANRMGDFAQFREFAADVNDLIKNSDVPVYALTLGDMAWDIFWYRYDLEDYLGEVNDDFGENLPVFHTIGNHDHESGVEGDFLTTMKFRSTLGPNYYSFNVGKIHYIVLDDIECMNTVEERRFANHVVNDELEWIKKDIKYVSKTTPIVITMHAQLYDDSGNVSQKQGYNGLLKLFEGYRSIHVFTGHTHIIYNVDRLASSVPTFEHNSGAVCGAWWMTGSNVGIHLSGDGAPGGYRIMDVDGADFKWQFKATSLPLDYQFRTYDRNSIELSTAKWTPDATTSGKQAFLEAVGEYSKASSDNYVLINVWDYDPSWTITVTENGKNLNVERLQDAKDPLYLVSYEAYEYENHWDDSVYYPAYTTKHIFRVKAGSPTSTLEIKVKDRFGRTYTETMKRPKAFKVEP